MKLSKEQFVQLRSAGFTERQITTMQEKFYILLNTVELPEPVHLHNIRVLKQQVIMLRDLIPKRIPDGFVSFGKYYAEQESIFNPSYKEMTKFKNKYLSDCEEALAATEPKP